MTLKIYTPLTGEFLPDEPELLDYETEESIPMDGYDLAPYKEAIDEALDRENHGGDGWDGNLMEYYHEEDGVKAKVSSAVISVEYHEGQLCGCATVELSEPLEGDELTRLMEYLSGQYSDGFGEGFEQRDIAVDGGVLNVHLWQTHGFSMTCEQPRRPKMMKKYEITGIAHPQYPWLHRVRALWEFRPDVKAGDLGGYVESEHNLSQEGFCWLFDNAIACNGAQVCKNAELHHQAAATRCALVTGDAKAIEQTLVTDHAIVCSGHLHGTASARGDALVRQNNDMKTAPALHANSIVYGEISGLFVLQEDVVVFPGVKLDNPTLDAIWVYKDRVRVLSSRDTAPQPPEKRTQPER